MEFITLSCPVADSKIRVVKIDGAMWFSMLDLRAAMDTSYLPNTIANFFLSSSDVRKVKFPGPGAMALVVRPSAVHKFSHLGKRGVAVGAWVKEVITLTTKPKPMAKVTPIRQPEPEVEPVVEPTAQPDASTFTFPVTGQTVRAAMVEGKPMFVASEVAAVLGYTNPQKAVRDHCKHLKLFKVNESFTLKTSPFGINMIPESDVYRLIIRSKLPAAEQFETWVMEVVLPAIRKDGMYIMGEEKVATGEMSGEELLSRAVLFANNKIERMAEEMAQLESSNAILALENNKMLPKAEMYDYFMDATGLISITNAGKIFGMSGQAMGRFLRDIDWLFQRTDEVIPRQHVLDAGLMGVITGAANGRPFTSGKLTTDGIEVIYRKYGLRKAV